MPLATAHVPSNKIILFCVDFLYWIIAARYGEGKLESALVHFWYHTHSLHWYSWHGTFSWYGWAVSTTSYPHGILSYSTTPFSSRLPTIFHITSESWGIYLGDLHTVSGWLSVSIWNENTRIGRRNPSSQNTYQYSVTTSLTFSCKSLGHPFSFIFVSNNFSLFRTSNTTTSFLGGRGYFACFNDIL